MLHLIGDDARHARGRARAALILGVATLTTAWLSVWMALLATAAGTTLLLPGPGQEAIVLGGAASAQWLLRGPLRERVARVLFVAGAALIAAVAVSARFASSWLPLALHGHGHLPAGLLVAVALTTVALWWAGGQIGASALDEYAVFRFFAIGVIGLFGGLILNALAGGHALPLAVPGRATAIFFAAAFLTLPAAQLVSARERGRARGAPVPPLDRRWIGTAGAATLGILALALVLSATSSGALLTAAATLLGRLPDLLVTLLSPLLIAAAYLAQALVELLRHVRPSPHTITQRAPRPRQPPRPPHAQHQAHLPLAVQAILGAIVLIAVAAIVVTALSRTIRRLSATAWEQEFEEERDSVWSWERAGAGWQGLLGRLRGRLRRARRPAPDAVVGPPRSIREAYRRLLRHGAALGHARAAPETPQEYLARLRAVPIQGVDDASALTTAYMRARYGDEPEQPADVERATHAWERLEQASRQPASTGRQT